jgi:phage recombination protein Bet
MKAKTETQSTLAPQQPSAAELGREQIELLKRTVCKGATDDEMRLFLAQCKRSGLDPFARQIYAVRRWDARERREVMTTQTSIDGLRLIADRTSKFQGELGPLWCAADGLWRDVWLEDGPPAAAKVGVLKEGCREPFWGVARFSEYCQIDRDGNPTSMWRKMPSTMVAKCAEANALRKAFPAEMSGLYSADEMQAGRDSEAPPVGPRAADSKSQPLSETKPASSARPWRNFKQMLDEFAKLHGRLGTDYEHVYYSTLGEFNVAHSNEFRNGDQAAACYSLLSERVLEIEAAADQADAMPPEDFDQPDSEAII